MNLKQKVIRNAILRGLPVQVFMGMGIYFTYQDGNMDLLPQLVAVTIIASSVSAASAIYDYDIWSVKKKIIVHTICMLFTVYPALIYSGWFGAPSLSTYLIAFLSFVLFGFVFCSIGYLVSKYILKNVPKETSSK